MPNASSPTSKSGCREFLCVTMLATARPTAAAASPRTHSPARSGTPPKRCSPTSIHGMNAPAPSSRPAPMGK